MFISIKKWCDAWIWLDPDWLPVAALIAPNFVSFNLFIQSVLSPSEGSPITVGRREDRQLNAKHWIKHVQAVPASEVTDYH